jgi:hypothetical protein
MALQVLIEQTRPAQQRVVAEPHATQRLVPDSQTKGSPQVPPPPVFDKQQGCPAPPQATHEPAEHVVDGAVQPTPPLQQSCPSLPHAPF